MTTDSTMDLLAGLAPVRDDELAGAAESVEARALLERLTASPAPRAKRSRWLAVPAVATVAVAVVAVALVSSGSEGTSSAAAATLERVAVVAQRQTPLIPRAGQYLYTKSVNAYMSTTAPTSNPDDAYSVLVPRVRQTWIGPNGGRLYETSGTPSFLSDRDRERWIAAGSPSLTEPAATTALSPAGALDLPADSDALYARLQAEAQGNGNGVTAEMFTLVGDALRETSATPEQRAALYEVASRLPGVQLLGDVRDDAGRRGVAVALDAHGIRSTLVFDPETSALLQEEEVALDGNTFGYPAGARTGFALYLVQAVVGSETSTQPVRAGNG